MVKKIIQNVKSYHFVYIILVILLIAGAGTGIFFYIKNKSTSPHRAPTSQCDSGKVECLKDGSVVCCDACCGGVCLKKGFTCIDGIQCEDKMVCTNPTTGEKTCCTTESPNCNETLGVCNACTPINPQCEGTTDGKNPICCGLNGNDCYVKDETKDTNPCVCSGGDADGMGGKCCSKNRSLCPGESYGQVNIRDKDDKDHKTRDSSNNCLLGPKNTKEVCITPLEDGSTTVAVEDIAIDDIGNQCHKNLIYKSDNQYLCCGTDGSEGEPSLYLDSDNTLKCCAGNKIVGGKSMCYTKSTFINMNNSPLEGKCSGASNDDSKNLQVCVNPTDFKSSTLSSTPCKDPEISVDLPYYDLINQPGKISYQNNGKDITNCPSDLSGNSENGCNNLPVFASESCTSDTECNNKSNLCKDREGNVHAAPCNPLAKNPTYKTGVCGIGCPADKPTTICNDGDGEICYTYEAKNKDGTAYESGFCGLPPKSGQQTPTSMTTPEHLVTQSDSENILYYDTEDNCKKFCGARFGYCDQVNVDGNTLFACKLPVCSAGNKNYIWDDKTVSLSGSNTITYTTGGTMSHCMLDQNKQYIDRITFNESTGPNSSASCTGEFDCSTMLTVPNDVNKMGPTYVEKPVLTGETLYTSDGKPTSIISGPFTLKSGHSCTSNGLPNGIFCNTNDKSCCGSAPAGIY